MTREEELAAFLAIKDELLSLLEPLDEDRMNAVPFAGSWTAGQLGDHLLKSYELVDWPKVKGAPAGRPVEAKSGAIDAVFSDYTKKYQPPGAVVPSSERIPGRMLVERLRNASEGIAAFVKGNDLGFTCAEFEVIGFGDLTAQEWIHFLTAHSRRHVRQLRAILGGGPLFTP